MLMFRSIRHSFTGAVLALVLGSFAGSATAQQQEWVNPDVIALRDDIEQMRRELARLQAGSAVNGGAGGAAPAGDYFVRLEQLETEMRRLIGEMERITFETSRAMRARDAQISELYARISELESAAGITPPQSSAPAPGSGPAISAPQASAATPRGGTSQPGTLGTLPGSGGDAVVADAPSFENGGSPASAPQLSPAQVATGATYEEALEFLRARDLEKAEGAFIGFIAGNPDDPRIGEATYWLGETYYVRGQYDKAARAFLTSFREHPSSAKAPDSLLRLGVTLAQLRQKDEACASFEQVAVRYPDAPQTLLRRADVEAKRAGCS